MPSYVDDVIEVSSFGTLPTTGETGKIYITLDTNKIYRWTGSVYVEVSSSAAVWGGITGTLSNQTDLQSALDAKQDDLNGTGFVKASGTTISYDNTTYYPASNPNGYTSNVGTVTSVALTVPSAFSVSGSPITSSGTLAITGAGTTAQYVRGDGTLATMPDISGFVPYTGATGNVDLGTHTIIAAKGTFSSSGSADTVGITHSSGSGIALNISKAGNGEGIYVNKTSGSGNAVTIIGTLNATTLVKSGGTSTQFLKADGSVDSSTYLTSASLSGYVDTTGDQSIAGQKTFTGFAYFDNTIFLKQTTSISFISGYNSIAASSSGIRMGITSGISALFNLTSLSTNRDYTLPNASGTLALTSDIPSLSGYVATTGDQTIAGIKTFTGVLNADILQYSESATAIYIPGYSQILGTADYFLFHNGVGTKQAKFIYNSGGGNDYNLPTGSGTLALTSDIHDAVTIGTANGLSLSTQVLSLALASTTTTGALSSTDWNTFNGKQNALTNPVTGTGTTSYLPKFTGTSAIGNSLLYDTGSVLLIGATSASDGQSKLELVGASTVGLKIISSGANGNNTFLSIQASKEWRFVTNRGDLIGGNQGDLIIRNNTDGINHIILNQGGSTTFAGSVTAVGATIKNPSTDGSTPLLAIRDTSNVYEIGYLNFNQNTDMMTLMNKQGYSASGISFGTNNTERMRINVNGNVGIGTSSPAEVFHVSTSNEYQISWQRTVAGKRWAFGIDGAGTYLSNRTDGVLPIYITNGGNVGIGTTAPSEKLHLNNASGAGAFIRFEDTGGSGVYLGGRNNNMELYAGGTERMRITSSGNVGIGTTSPSEALTVSRATSTASYICGTNGSGVQTAIGVAGDNGSLLGTLTNHDLRIVTNGSVRATITSGGQIFMYNLSSGAGTNAARYSTATGQLTYDTSSARYKNNIRDSVYGLSDVLKMRSAMFEYKEDNRTDVGLIAEELHLIIPELVGIDKLGRPDSVSYDRLVSVLIKSVQELKAELDTLKNK